MIRKTKFCSILLLIATLALINISCGSSKSNLNTTESVMTVKMNINYTSDYCGGAYPSEDILAALKKERPLSKKKFFILKVGDDREKMIEVTTANDGSCTMELQPGKYQIFLPEKMSSPTGKFISQEACDNWKKTPNGTFDVTTPDQELIAKVHKTCNPCQEPAR
ncbi:MAG: hypothetical protein AAFN93_27525 [Bacteroidota bacterium]